MPKKDLLVYGMAGLIALIGGIAISYGTQLGPWTMGDTIDYFDVARNLSQGRGLVMTRPSGFDTPMTVHPPFYSMILSLGLLLNVKLLDFARMLNILLFTVLVLALILWTYRLTTAATLSIGLGLWALSNRAIFRNYTAALSEPLFLTLGMVSIYLTLEYILSKKRWLMITAAVLAGLSLATRYSGAAFLVAGFSTILIWEKTTWTQKIKNLSAYSLVSSGPILLWIAYLRIGFPGSTPGRYELVENIWEVMTPFRLTYTREFWSWLGLNLLFSTQDYRIQVLLIALILFVLGLAAFLSIRIALRENPALDADASVFPGSIWIVFAIASTAILLFSYVFVEYPKPWLDERLYSPLQIGTIISIICAVQYCAAKLMNKPYQVLPVFVGIALLIAAGAPKTIDAAYRLHDTGEGYTSKYWNDKKMLDALQDIPSDKRIITNDPGAIFFFLGRTSSDLIPIIEYTDTNDVPSVFREHGVVVVLFEQRLSYQIRERYGGQTTQYIHEITQNLLVQYKGNIGTIYIVK